VYKSSYLLTYLLSIEAVVNEVMLPRKANIQRHSTAVQWSR